MNILIVDDSRFLRMTNERALTRIGHNVICASDGEEGLRLALERSPTWWCWTCFSPNFRDRKFYEPFARIRRPS